MSHFISLEEAVDMTALYRQQREQIIKTQFQNNDLLPLSETFDRGTIDALLSKTGCAALRIYYGMSTDYKVHAVIVAVNENNEDILPAQTLSTTEDDYIIERGNRCPDICPEESPLNT